jgi:formylglycine-generating enzyme required for sulfatase activity
MEFVLIPAGTFAMGSPPTEGGRDEDEIQHQVTISQPYYMGVTEVTYEAWDQIYEDPSGRPAKEPVNFEAGGFMQWFLDQLSEREGLTYRFPTEAEWEYAARAGSSSAYCYGDDPQMLTEYAWFGIEQPQIVAQKLPTHGAFMTCTETSPNGAWIFTRPTRPEASPIRKAKANPRIG